MVCAATSMLVITIPGGSGGYVHLGDTVIYLAAALLPVPYAVAAAAIGAGLADVLLAPSWAPFTIAIKAVMAMAFTAKKETLMCRRNAVAPVLAGAVCVAGYYGAEIALACASGSSFTARLQRRQWHSPSMGHRLWPAAFALWCWRCLWISWASKNACKKCENRTTFFKQEKGRFFIGIICKKGCFLHEVCSIMIRH